MLRAIGRPALVEADVPISRLTKNSFLPERVMKQFLGFSRDGTHRRLKHEDRIVQPLSAAFVRRIVRYPDDPEFLRLTGCEQWREPLA